ncbi:MAG: hypothetical protein BM557_08170 [Flavobacterium sp. MedPE-SWcel]|uniref:heavy-metal-associated domain-containing protein n=1 Tax=uncultured Flavobacterium sp. TaxID=165435 RepID=UPI00090F3254|nr:heavy-metal-associated domain-containing protein [uncultured Flavobacterium sp.]OIQ17656.1 MAG: hypothetical protein BM557_08170 [Flavobacterium sp. MedPE-SWcel]
MINLVKKLSFFALVALLSVSCKDAAKEGETETTPAVEATTEETTEATPEVAANLETTTFKIDGMTCAVGCAGVIENKLAGLDGVENAEVDFENKTATISFDAAKQTPETIVGTVENVADGIYTVSEITNSGDKAELFKADQEQEKKKKKSKTAKTPKTAKTAKGCSSKKCCSSKKACGDKKAKKA